MMRLAGLVESKGATRMALESKVGRNAKLEKAVKDTHERSIEAILSYNSKADTRAIEEEFSAAFRSAGGDWQFKSRDDLVRGLESGRLKYKSIRNNGAQVKLPTPNVAIVTGQRSVEAIIDGKEFSSTFENTAVYALEENKWKVLIWAVSAC
jgi:hypothetical protein